MTSNHHAPYEQGYTDVYKRQVDDLNAKIRDYNDKVDTAKNAAANSKATIDSAVSELRCV